MQQSIALTAGAFGMSKQWANFETLVRTLATFIWDKECAPKNIGGVDIDGVISVDDDVSVFIEITERDDLAKVREDVVKLPNCQSCFASGHWGLRSLLLRNKWCCHKGDDSSRSATQDKGSLT